MTKRVATPSSGELSRANPLLGRGPVETFPTSSVLRLFEQRAALAPERPAVADAVRSLSYGALDRQANQLARHLLSAGLQPGERVLVTAGRSVEMVLGVLALLKAGAVYVPVDVRAPRDRLAHMARQAAVRLHLTAGQPPGRDLKTDVPTLHLDQLMADARSLPSGPPHAAHDDEGAAYVIFTSGSSGAPKGVEVPQRALANAVVAFQRALAVRAHHFWAALLPLHFDPAALDLFTPLSVGAMVRVFDPDHLVQGTLAEELAAVPVHFMMGTPSFLKLLADAGWRGGVGLSVISGGEPLSQALAARIQRDGAELWNAYGPTECTIVTTMDRVEPGGEVTLGRPLPNNTCYVLDQALAPVPPGQPGELFIGGAQVAIGYVGQLKLTAERFLPDPFSDVPGARMYRSGDMVVLRPDGRLVFQGREDGQVKLRGYRIELGEVERAAVRCRGVARCVVLKSAVEQGEHLVAFVELEADASFDEDYLRRQLLRWLPEYMVPSAVCCLDRLPLLASGKLDRQGLQAMAATRLAESLAQGAGSVWHDAQESVAPSPAVAEMIRSVAGRSEIPDMDATLAQVGLDSLMRLALKRQLERALGHRLGLTVVHPEATARSIECALEREDGAGQGSLDAAAVTDERTSPSLPQGTGHVTVPCNPSMLAVTEGLEPTVASVFFAGGMLFEAPGPLTLGALSDALGRRW